MLQHVKDGLMVERLEDGAVRLVKTKSETNGEIVADVLLEAEDWQRFLTAAGFRTFQATANAPATVPSVATEPTSKNKGRKPWPRHPDGKAFTFAERAAALKAEKANG